MKRAARSFICLTLCLLALGCSATKPSTAHIEVHQQYAKCPQPPRPAFAKLPENGPHIGSSVVVDKLTKNIVEWELYSNATDGALDCYEAQAKQ